MFFILLFFFGIDKKHATIEIGENFLPLEGLIYEVLRTLYCRDPTQVMRCKCVCAHASFGSLTLLFFALCQKAQNRMSETMNNQHLVTVNKYYIVLALVSIY